MISQGRPLFEMRYCFVGCPNVIFQCHLLGLDDRSRHTGPFGQLQDLQQLVLGYQAEGHGNLVTLRSIRDQVRGLLHLRLLITTPNVAVLRELGSPAVLVLIPPGQSECIAFHFSLHMLQCRVPQLNANECMSQELAAAKRPRFARCNLFPDFIAAETGIGDLDACGIFRCHRGFLVKASENSMTSLLAESYIYFKTSRLTDSRSLKVESLAKQVNYSKSGVHTQKLPIEDVGPTQMESPRI